jgi:bifunctional N-acetylglucosamine-1-phosphate-uridyltransferase/glucosamine-1-phosphate-acetyltransferase GlmU-like protein
MLTDDRRAVSGNVSPRESETGCAINFVAPVDLGEEGIVAPGF